MVVAALKVLHEDESALSSQLDLLRSQDGGGKPETVFNRIRDLNSRARRIERLLDAMVDRGEVC